MDTYGPRPDPRIDAALRAIAPDSVRVGSRLIDARDLATLHVVEAAAVRRAGPQRRAEFASGRALLRELLGSHDPIEVRENRAPLLPGGWRGSLAHDHGVAVAAVTDRPQINAIGIDVEPTTALTENVARLILRDDERGVDAHLAFTLKEAVYKAWSSLGGPLLDHRDVRILVRDGSFTGTVVPAGVQLEGRFTVAADRWLAIVLSAAPDVDGPAS